MKKIIFSFILLFSFNAYAEIKDCKYNLDINKNGDIIDSLFNDKNYSYKDANGKLCFTSEEGIISLILKNGKAVGDIEFILYYEDNKPMFQMYFSDYRVLGMIGELVNEGNGDINLSVLKDNKLNMKYTFFYENGNIYFKSSIQNGNGSITSYKENGAMDIYRPIKNYQFNGTAEVYSENGRLWATLTYKDGEIIAGKCVNERKNGSEWTKAEISNWENGLPVDCNYL